jgi:hypothetical protein
LGHATPAPHWPANRHETQLLAPFAARAQWGEATSEAQSASPLQRAAGAWHEWSAKRQVPPFGQSPSPRQATQARGLAVVRHFGVAGFVQSASTLHCFTWQVLSAAQPRPGGHWSSVRQATQAPVEVAEPALQWVPFGLLAHSWSEAQVVAAGVAHWFWAEQTRPAAQSAAARQGTHCPPGAHRLFGALQPASLRQPGVGTQAWVASQIGFAGSKQSSACRHSTQLRAVTLQTGFARSLQSELA